MRDSVVASIPLRAEQRFALPHAGTYDLYVEGVRFRRDFGGVDFALADPAGAVVNLRPVLFRTTVSAVSRVRLLLRRFTAPGAGTFTLRITGIKPDQDPENRIVFATPVTARMVLHILAIIALGMLLLGSLIASVLLVAER